MRSWPSSSTCSSSPNRWRRSCSGSSNSRAPAPRSPESRAWPNSSSRVRANRVDEPDGERIEIHDLHFAYDEGVDILTAIELTVRPGERLALVGPSGAGKTTLARLVAGSEVPGRGEVTIGGVGVADLQANILRRHILLVTQEQHLFMGTIRDNLRLASPNASDEEIAEALETIGADWVESLEDGLDTELGFFGYQANASQIQQIALARVVLADPHTVVLDEATSLLDPGLARRTERALSAVMEGRTIVAVAHRLQTARDADRIAVMEDGEIIEVGSHDDLLRRDGAYRTLWRSWVGEDVPDPVRSRHDGRRTRRLVTGTRTRP